MSFHCRFFPVLIVKRTLVKVIYVINELPFGKMLKGAFAFSENAMPEHLPFGKMPLR